MKTQSKWQQNSGSRMTESEKFCCLHSTAIQLDVLSHDRFVRQQGVNRFTPESLRPKNRSHEDTKERLFVPSCLGVSMFPRRLGQALASLRLPLQRLQLLLEGYDLLHEVRAVRRDGQ